MRLLIKDTPGKLGENVLIQGWVQTRRNLGKIVFLDVRDRTEMLQVICAPGELGDFYETVKEVRSEFVVEIEGVVNKRNEKNINPEIATGKIELLAKSFKILSSAEPLPFDPADEKIGMDVYLDLLPLTLRTEKNRALFKIQAEIVNAFRDFLLSKDFTRDEILESGLALASSFEVGSLLDRFRNRLIFPITNNAGDVCAFAGRILDNGGEEAKYLNSPETPIYYKSSVLYGLSHGKTALRGATCAVIVEGYMDCLSAYQAGIKNVVACSGTALTSEHLALLKRFTGRLIFSFDRDGAGVAATLRAIELAFSQGLRIDVAVWDGSAKDPDECIAQDPDTFKKAVEKPLPATDYLLSHFITQYGSDSIDGKHAIVSGLMPFVLKMESALVRDEWLKEIASRLSLNINSLYDECKRAQGKMRMPARIGQRNITMSNQSEMRNPTPKKVSSEEYLLGLLLTYPEMFSVANQLISENDLSEIELQNIYRSLTTQYNQALSEQERKRADVLSLMIESTLPDASQAVIRGEVVESVRALVRRRTQQEKKLLVDRLKNSDGSQRLELINSYQELLEKEEKIARYQ